MNERQKHNFKLVRSGKRSSIAAIAI